LRWLLALALAQWALCLEAEAQVPPDAGSIQRQQQPPTLAPPPPPAPPVQVESSPAPSLQGSSDVRFTLTGFHITGESVFAEQELLTLVQDLVGTSVGFADLEQAAERVSRYYRKHGYVVARAYLPEQELRDGVVQIAVLEGHIGRVIIENHSRVRDSVIAARVDGLQGRLVREEDINAKLRLVYDLTHTGPGPEATLNPGANVGETDLVLQPPPGPLVSGSVALNNYGNPFTGANQLSGELDFNSPAHLGDLLSLQGTEGLRGRLDEPGLGTYKVSYQVPASASGLLLGANYAHVHYRLGGDFEALDANGTADTWLAFASHPLLVGRTYSVHAQLSYQESDLQDRIESPATITDKTSRIGTLALTSEWQDAWAGGGANAASVSYNLGRLHIESPEALAIDAATAQTAGKFQTWNLNLTRLQQLSAHTALNIAFAGQKADKNLDSSQKLILGGPYGIQDYPQGEAPGDSGYLVNAELRYDLTGQWIGGHTQLLGLADTGRVNINQDPFAAGTNHRELSSAGAGLNWTNAHALQLRLMVAHKVGDARATSDTDHDTRAWLQLLQRF
jgi:hemolysin activation/secretion protein